MWAVRVGLLLGLPLAVLLVGGVSLVVGAGGGLVWILSGSVLVFVAASVNAWVLLVEILR